MIIRHRVVTRNLLLIAAALLLGGNVVLFHPWLPPVVWEMLAPVLACPYLVPPECVDPLPGL